MINEQHSDDMEQEVRQIMKALKIAEEEIIRLNRKNKIMQEALEYCAMHGSPAARLCLTSLKNRG